MSRKLTQPRFQFCILNYSYLFSATPHLPKRHLPRQFPLPTQPNRWRSFPQQESPLLLVPEQHLPARSDWSPNKSLFLRAFLQLKRKIFISRINFSLFHFINPIDIASQYLRKLRIVETVE